MVDKV